MKVRELVQRVQTKDPSFSARHIFNIALSVRSTLISQKINKKQFINQWNYQTLNCVEMVEAPPHECECLPPVGCYTARTKYPVPKPMSGLSGHFIQSVTSINGEVTYSETTWKDKKYKKGSKYTANKPDYYFKNGYIYVTSRKPPKAIEVTYLFDNFLEALNYKGLCYKPCKISTVNNPCPECVSPLDQEFLLDKDMEKTVIELIFQELGISIPDNRRDMTDVSEEDADRHHPQQRQRRQES